MTAQNKRTSERRPADPIPIISERPVQLTARTTTPALADPEPLLRAIESSGNLAFTMSFKQGFPARILAGKNPIGSAGDTIIMGDVVHPDDYQPFCEVIAQVTAGTADEIKLHARLNNGGDYQWFYITGKVHRSGSPLEFIEGMMFNVTDYLDCEGEDIVMRRYRSKHSVKINDQSTYTLRDILGEDYLVRIQQPLSQASGLFSAITDNDGAVILPKGQDRKINLNKMDYQRKRVSAYVTRPSEHGSSPARVRISSIITRSFWILWCTPSPSLRTPTLHLSTRWRPPRMQTNSSVRTSRTR